MVGFGDLRVAESWAETFGQGKSVALTFDDGPEPEPALKAILQTLAEHKPPIHAEFYVLGNAVKAKPHLLSLIQSGKHKIQNHTWDHKSLPGLKEDKILDEVKQTQDIIAKTANVRPTKVRPPYGAGGFPGHIDPKLQYVATSLNLKIQNWDIDTYDWAEKTGLQNDPILREKGQPKRLEFIKRQFKNTKKSSPLIVLMHVRAETARDLPSFVAQLETWGFDFAEPSD
jgi:peptidoglycan-N-acetylglucosamine deacetylase